MGCSRPKFQPKIELKHRATIGKPFLNDKKTLGSGRRYDRRYRAEYELFKYFNKNQFLSRNFNSVTNNSNNAYNISDRNRI